MVLKISNQAKKLSQKYDLGKQLKLYLDSRDHFDLTVLFQTSNK